MEHAAGNVPNTGLIVSERSETPVGNTETLEGMQKFIVTTSISVPIDFDHEIWAKDPHEACAIALERTKKRAIDGVRRWDLASQPVPLAVEDAETGEDLTVPCLVARVSGGAK